MIRVVVLLNTPEVLTVHCLLVGVLNIEQHFCFARAFDDPLKDCITDGFGVGLPDIVECIKDTAEDCDRGEFVS